MTRLLLQAFTVAIMAGISAASGGISSWGYDNGPEGGRPGNWSDNYPTCGGNAQSPINLDETIATYDSALGALELTGYGSLQTNKELVMTNNGHTVSVAVTGNATISLGVPGLTGVYNLVQFHLHWGTVDAQGSEHTVGGSPFPAEIHLVHLHETYERVQDALNDPDGLAVLGIFVEIGAASTVLGDMVGLLPNISSYNSSVTLPTFTLGDLLPASRSGYFRYPGSLTTPPCSEVVTWSVLKNPITMSSAQVAAFRDLRRVPDDELIGNDTDKVVDNFRRVKPLGNRVLKVSEAVSGSVRLIGGFVMTSLMALLLNCL